MTYPNQGLYSYRDRQQYYGIVEPETVPAGAYYKTTVNFKIVAHEEYRNPDTDEILCKPGDSYEIEVDAWLTTDDMGDDFSMYDAAFEGGLFYKTTLYEDNNRGYWYRENGGEWQKTNKGIPEWVDAVMADEKIECEVVEVDWDDWDY